MENYEGLEHLLSMPTYSEALVMPDCLQDAENANLPMEQLVLLMQIRKAISGDTDAAVFVFEQREKMRCEQENAAISEAAANGDQMELLKAVQAKLSRLLDAAVTPKDASSVSKQLLSVNAQIEELAAAQRNKKGENPLNVIRRKEFNRKASA